MIEERSKIIAGALRRAGLAGVEFYAENYGCVVRGCHIGQKFEMFHGPKGEIYYWNNQKLPIQTLESFLELIRLFTK